MSKQKKRSKRHRKIKRAKIIRTNKIKRAMSLQALHDNWVYDKVVRDMYEIALRKGA